MPATDLERLVVQLSADIKQYEKATARATGITNKRMSEIEARVYKMNANLERSFTGLGNTIRSSLDGALRSTVAQIGGVLGAREIAAYADAWTEAGNKIRAAAEIAGVQTRSLNELKTGANDARSEFSAYVDLYAKLIRSASNVAKSETEIATATSIVAKSFKAGGAAANEQAAGILQLGQALGSGVLQGDELRSLRENAPILADAIAKEFKTTISGLKDLGAEGKITSDRVFKAILAAQAPIEAAFGKTNSTISDAMTRINNEFTAYIGNADTSAGATTKLVEALQYLADNFKEVGDLVLQFVTIIVGALTGRALVGVVAGLGNAVAALGSFISAVRAGTLVAGGLAAALGPIGLIAGGAAAAIYLLVDGANATESAIASANTAIAGNASALDAAKTSSEGYTAALRDQIKMQYEVAKASFDLAYAEFNAARARAENFRSMAKALTGYEMSFDPFEYAAKTADDNASAIGAAALKLRAQLEKIDSEMGDRPSGFGGGAGAAPSGKTKTPKKTADDKFREDIQAIRDRTAALVQEQAVVSLSYQEQEKRRLAIDLEQRALADLREEARKKGQTDLDNVRLSAGQLATIDEVSSAYAKQADILRQVEDAQQNAQSAAQEFYDTARSGFANVVLGAESVGDALKNLGNKLAELLLNSAFDNIFGGGPSKNAGGGLLTNIFKGLGFRASGGPVSKGKPYVVGEKRAELFVPNQSGTILPSLPTAPTLPKISSMGGGVISPTVNFAPVYNVQGSGPEIAQLREQMAKDKAQVPGIAVKAMKEARGRTSSF